jgi:MoaA/NifB/PqqE/SkfB family radical SAM enzyme/GT2 family glycosyltransferase
VELTSKCPADCVFCSRSLRRGAGEHLPFSTFESLVASLEDPRRFVLNYSGESTVYPELLPAIRLARSTGAYVELVSMLMTVPEPLLEPLARSGLNRLTVSLHAVDPEAFAQIYRYGSFSLLRSRLEKFLEICRRTVEAPAVDVAFVAMDRNLPELPGVASLASSLGVRNVSIFPVMRRDDIPVQFPSEIASSGEHQPEFRERVRKTAATAEAAHPEIRFNVCNEAFVYETPCLGRTPVPYPWPLPEGACIHSCEQNPWETAHVLANGDVVACEVQDRLPLGNLHRESIREIWTGERYRRFREEYGSGRNPHCRACPWKRAYRPAPLASEILGNRGLNPQLAWGWHEPVSEAHVWSTQRAAAVIAPRPASDTLHVSGMLPPGPEGSANELKIRLNGVTVGKVVNPYEEIVSFGMDFAAPRSLEFPWQVEFRTRHVLRPCVHGTGSDQRDLGFALVLLVSKEHADAERVQRQRQSLRPLLRWVQRVDSWCLRCGPHFRRPVPHGKNTLRPGLSIIVPERDNLEELTPCLESAHAALRHWPEAAEIIAVVNGASPSVYRSLQSAYPSMRWRFSDRPLGFTAAVQAGLRMARYDWVYLLNNDVVLDPLALCALAPHRGPDTFSIASQVFFKDATRFREETNWTTLLIQDGLATIHDRIPPSDTVVPTFYAGGGASLFDRRRLASLLDTSIYDPFYWEDVEWGWRARKAGLSSLFCPASHAYHTHRATIGKHYSPRYVEQVLQRNRFLFQLRNLTTAGSIAMLAEEMEKSDPEVFGFFEQRRTRWAIARARIWNHCAPRSDEEVIRNWMNPHSYHPG